MQIAKASVQFCVELNIYSLSFFKVLGSIVLHLITEKEKSSFQNVTRVNFIMCCLHEVWLQLTSGCPFYLSQDCFVYVVAGLSQIIICLMWNRRFITSHYCYNTKAMFLSSVYLNSILNITTNSSVIGRLVEKGILQNCVYIE